MNDQLTEQIIGFAFKIHNQLGFGFLESVYEKALSIELNKAGISHSLQHPIKVFYENEIVGDFYADVFVENQLILELKAINRLSMAHEVQLVNYLVATRTDRGLLINFGPQKVDVRRKFRQFNPDTLV